MVLTSQKATTAEAAHLETENGHEPLEGLNTDSASTKAAIEQEVDPEVSENADSSTEDEQETEAEGEPGNEGDKQENGELVSYEITNKTTSEDDIQFVTIIKSNTWLTGAMESIFVHNTTMGCF